MQFYTNEEMVKAFFERFHTYRGQMVVPMLEEIAVAEALISACAFVDASGRTKTDQFIVRRTSAQHATQVTPLGDRFQQLAVRISSDTTLAEAQSSWDPRFGLLLECVLRRDLLAILAQPRADLASMACTADIMNGCVREIGRLGAGPTFKASVKRFIAEANSRARHVQQYFNGLNDQVPGAELLRFDCSYEAADLSCLDAVTAGKPKINMDIDNLDAAMKGILGERLLGRVWARDYSRRRGHQVHWALLISPNRSAPDPISLIAQSWSEITSGTGSLYDARVPNAAFQFRGLSVPIGHYFQGSTAEFIRRTAVFMGATALYSKHLSVGTTFSHH